MGFNCPQRQSRRRKKKFVFRRKEVDPNAMDIDTMTFQERTELMKKGACFHCKQVRHLSRDCPNKTFVNTVSTCTPLPTPKKITSGKEAFAHIQALMAELDEKKKEKVFSLGEEEGFWWWEHHRPVSLLVSKFIPLLFVHRQEIDWFHCLMK